MGARPSDVRAWLLEYAKRNKITVQEHVSDDPGKRIAYMCCLTDRIKVIRSISHDGFDNALVMAFLNWCKPEMDFLPFPE